MLKASRTFLFVCLATTALGAPAYAENPEIVDVLLANIEKQTGTKVTFESAEEDGDGNVTITKLSFAPATAAGFKLTIGEIELNDVGDEDEGLYEVGEAIFTDMKAGGTDPDGQPFSVSLPEGKAESWFVYDPGENPEPSDTLRASMTVAKKISTGPLAMNFGSHAISVDGYQSNWDGDPATGAGTFDSKVANIAIPETLIAAADPSGTLKNLGYAGLNLDISGNGEYRVDDTNFGIDLNFGVAAKDMAGLKFAVNADAIPIAAYAELQKAQASGKEPDFNAMMPQLQNVTVGAFTVRFEDASITKKLLPMIAAMSGMGDEAALVANAGAMAQLGLMQLNNPEFAKQAVDAINAFLKDPKSFTVQAKPGAPVTVAQLMAANPSDPGALIKLLNVMISAND